MLPLHHNPLALRVEGLTIQFLIQILYFSCLLSSATHLVQRVVILIELGDLMELLILKAVVSCSLKFNPYVVAVILHLQTLEDHQQA